MPFDEFLLSKNIKPDFALNDALDKKTDFSEKGIEYIHRKINDAEVYFVSNQFQESQTIRGDFPCRS